MKNIGMAAIILGVLVLILAAAGVIGQGNMRASLIGAVVLLLMGWFLYRRNVGRS